MYIYISALCPGTCELICISLNKKLYYIKTFILVHCLYYFIHIIYIVQKGKHFNFT